MVDIIIIAYYNCVVYAVYIYNVGDVVTSSHTRSRNGSAGTPLYTCTPAPLSMDQLEEKEEGEWVLR